MANKRLEISSPNWCNISYDILDLVLSRLSFFDKVRVQGVCSSWRSFAKTYMSNLTQFPLIMLPTNKYGFKNFDSLYGVSEDFGDSQDITYCDSENFCDCCLFKIEDKKFKKFKSLPREMENNPCLGSSQGLLVFFHKKEKRYHVYNPFFHIRFRLCSLKRLSDVFKIILWSDPILSGNKYAIVALHEIEPKIAYAMCRDRNWSYLEAENFPYLDIICCKDFVYALGKFCCIEAWDFSTYKPTKKFSIHPPILREIDNDFEGIPVNYYALKWYLIQSQDRLLMAVRYVEAFVKVCENGVIEYRHFPYKTKKFRVYGLNQKEEKWEKTDSLGDMLLLLGTNHSVSLVAKDFQGYEKNSIYFTDDNDQWIPGCYHSGHDSGVFNLEDGSSKLFIGNELRRLKPYPRWVVPRILTK